MKYYVIERKYDEKGKVLDEARITGDITDLSWAKSQMDYRFNQKMIDYRHEIKPGTIKISSDKCEMNLNTFKYAISIEKVSKKPSAMTPRQCLIALSNKYDGDFDAIYNCVAQKKLEECTIDLLAKSRYSKVVTLLDEEYPEMLKKSHKPPFVLYFAGNLKLISEEYKNRICVYTSRYTEENYLDKIISDIGQLPISVVIVTSNKSIALGAIKTGHNVVLVLASGILETTPQIDEETKRIVLTHGGLIITSYPDSKTADIRSVLVKNNLMVNISTALLIGQAPELSSCSQFITTALNGGKDIMAYPTKPENGTLNNRLIQDGAELVENANDIMNILK